jgi:hypothetical protein
MAKWDSYDSLVSRRWPRNMTNGQQTPHHPGRVTCNFPRGNQTHKKPWGYLRLPIVMAIRVPETAHRHVLRPEESGFSSAMHLWAEFQCGIPRVSFVRNITAYFCSGKENYYYYYYYYSLSPLCRVFTVTFLKQTMSLANTVLQPFCSYYSQCI